MLRYVGATVGGDPVHHDRRGCAHKNKCFHADKRRLVAHNKRALRAEDINTTKAVTGKP